MSHIQAILFSHPEVVKSRHHDDHGRIGLAFVIPSVLGGRPGSTPRCLVLSRARGHSSSCIPPEVRITPLGPEPHDCPR